MKKVSGALKQDLARFYRYKGGQPGSGMLKRLLLCFFSYELHCVAVFRFERWAYLLYKQNKMLGFLPRVVGFILSKLCELLHHVVISPCMDVGPGLLIMHASSILVGARHIGSNFTVYQNVTIGWGPECEDIEAPPIPEIGDNVWIGAGAVVWGDIKIGNDVTISAGSIVSKDIPDNYLVAGNPGRVINTNYYNPIQNAYNQQ
jgi:serine O-acetyltransferase